MAQNLILTVTQLNRYVRSLLEEDPGLTFIFVTGEISNFKAHYASGHFYFSLKDDGGVIRSVMFRSAAARLKWMPENGMKVICRGRVSLYERDGQYQLYVDDMQPDGLGALTLAAEQLRKRLAAEGLFDEENKQPLPKFPDRIAVLTAADGAAVRDIRAVLGRRWPLAEVLLCPVTVQGESAAAEISALARPPLRNGGGRPDYPRTRRRLGRGSERLQSGGAGSFGRRLPDSDHLGRRA